MRTLARITAVLMASMALWSCDQQQQQQAQAPAAAPVAPVAQACNCTPPPPPCNCTPQAAAPAPAFVPRRRHHHHHWYYASERIMPGAPGYVSDSGAAEYASAQYSSSSSVSYVRPPVAGPSFVDGYGRAHFWSGGEIAHFARQADGKAFFEHKRLDPWHKYDATCDWR